MKIPFERFLNIRWAAAASMRHDGGRLAFLTDITGTAQLWTLDRALAWPEQLTFYEDRLVFARYSPTSSQIAFGKDVGGDENMLIYLIDDAGGLARKLSVQRAKHMWGGWSHDGKRMAWSHNGRNGRDFDLYVYDLESGEETMVWEGDGYNYVSAWFPDDSKLVVGCAESNVETDYYLLDLEQGERRHLTPHTGEAVYSDACVLPDASAMYLLTNEGAEFVNLARLDFASGELELLEDAQWDREELALSDDGRFLVVLTNVEGYTKIEVRDLAQDVVREVESFAEGVFGGVRFEKNSSTFTMTVTGPADSTDVWYVDATSEKVQRWTRSSMAGIRRDTLVSPELVHYHSFDGLEIPALYYRPKGDGPFPVVIDIHGGPEAQRRPTFSASTQYFVQEGLAVFAPNVRGSRGYGKTYMALDNVRKRMDSVADIKAAYEWLVREGGADPDRIAVMGGSYGGFMVLSAMVTYPELWAAGVDIVGIANFVTFLENTSDYRRHLRESEYGSLETDRDFLIEISPLTHIDKIAAPLMVVHGANDPRVPVGEAEQVIEAVAAKGYPVESLIYEDEGHGLAKRVNRLDAYPKIATFLLEHLS